MNKKLINFIKSARNKGYSDLQIREALIEYKWPANQITEAFNSLNPVFKLKNQVCIFLSQDLINKLQKRSKKNLFTLSEQIEDILRRSCLSQKTANPEKLDDTLVSLFSRKR
jgi:hypothetical protein